MIVVIESPYNGDRRRNVTYARRAMEDSLTRGEAPYLSHLLYTQVLDDTDPELRRAGIDAGLAYHHVADRIVFYVDYGMSEGMVEAKRLAEAHGYRTEERYIGINQGFDSAVWNWDR